MSEYTDPQNPNRGNSKHLFPPMLSIDSSTLEIISKKHSQEHQIELYEKPIPPSHSYPLRNLSLTCIPETDTMPMQVVGNITFATPQSHSDSLHAHEWIDPEIGYDDESKAIAVMEACYADLLRNNVPVEISDDDSIGIQIPIAKNLRIDVWADAIGESIFNIKSELISLEDEANTEKDPDTIQQRNILSVQAASQVWSRLQEVILDHYRATDTTAPKEADNTPQYDNIRVPRGFEKVAGYEQQKVALMDFYEKRLAGDIAQKFGTTPNVGMVLSGPEGNGKTMLAYSFAEEIGATASYIDLPSFPPEHFEALFSHYMEQPEKQVIIIDNMQLLNSIHGPVSAYVIGQIQQGAKLLQSHPNITLIGMAVDSNPIDKTLFEPGGFSELRVTPTDNDLTAMWSELITDFTPIPDSLDDIVNPERELHISNDIDAVELGRLSLRKGLSKSSIKKIFALAKHNAFNAYMHDPSKPIGALDQEYFIRAIKNYDQG